MNPVTPRHEDDGQRLLDMVFEDRSRRAAWSLTTARVLPWLIAIGAHGILWLAAVQSEPSLEAWSARMALRVHRELEDSAPTELSTAQSPEEAPEVAEAEPEPMREPQPREAAPYESLPDEPAPARPADPEASSTEPAEAPARSESLARAGRVVTREPDSAEPVDLTDHTFVTGEAAAYAGGVTLREGTGSRAVEKRPRAPRRSPQRPGRSEKGRGEGSQAQPVRLPENEWDCPWPAAALDREIYEQAVILRVVVRADGSVESARVLEDPGHGFGKAAMACARSTRFSPARDAAGRPVRAVSPPIRVRFTR